MTLPVIHRRFGAGFELQCLVRYTSLHSSCPVRAPGWLKRALKPQIQCHCSSPVLHLFAGETQLGVTLGFSANTCSSGWLQGKSRKMVNFLQPAHFGGACSCSPVGSELIQGHLPIAKFSLLDQPNCICKGGDFCPSAIRVLVS